jgi:hypothetical protein
MAENSSNANLGDDPKFKAIIDAIEEVSQFASRNPVIPSSSAAGGFLSTEMQSKFIALGEMLESFSHQRGR